MERLFEKNMDKSSYTDCAIFDMDSFSWWAFIRGLHDGWSGTIQYGMGKRWSVNEARCLGMACIIASIPALVCGGFI